MRNAFILTTNQKWVPTLVNMDSSPPRDNLIYNLDKDYLKDLKKETRKKSFNLNDYLPNSLRKHAKMD